MPLAPRELAVVATFSTGLHSKLSLVSELTASWLGNTTHHMMLLSQQYFCHATEGKNIFLQEEMLLFCISDQGVAVVAFHVFRSV